MNTLLINLTRFGDLLQSQAAIRSLKSDGKIGLVCLENFVETTGLLQGLDVVFPLPGSLILAGLDQSRPGSSWESSLVVLDSWRQHLKGNFSPYTVCNLTPSLAARMLARYCAGSEPVSGFAVDEFGFGLNSSPWAAFLQGAARFRGVSPFNVVDLFRAVAGNSFSTSRSGSNLIEGGALDFASYAETKTPVKFARYTGPAWDSALVAPEDATIRRMREKLEGLAHVAITNIESIAGLNSDGYYKGFIALQPGASEERRRWPIESFAVAAAEVWENHKLIPVLLGSKAEAGLAEDFTRQAVVRQVPAISLMGETNLEELSAALCICRILLTNDTGTMHLAAGLGVPVLAIFLATAQAWDTGPYSESSFSLEPDMDCHPCAFGVECPNNLLCRKSIKGEVVGSLASTFLEKGSFVELERTPAMQEYSARNYEGARIWRTVRDDNGFMDLFLIGNTSSMGKAGQDRTLWMKIQRNFLRQFLDRNKGQDFSLKLGLSPLFNGLSAEAKTDLGSDLERLHALLGLLLQQGELLLATPISALRERFMQSLQRVNTAFFSSTWLAALALLWREETQSSNEGMQEILFSIGHYKTLTGGLLEQLRS